MSAGAVFKLVANDGKADRMIMATALLNQRIKDVMCARASAGKEDPTPTLVDLEKTHIVYVNAHFKPFAAVGFEYNKVRASAGNPTLGSSVTFSIPQFGDFFHDMVLRTRLSSFQGNALLSPTPFANEFFYDAYGRCWSTTTSPATQAAAFGYYNLVRYCEYPANRLVAQVKFDVNGNPLDQYSVHVSTMLEKFTVPVGKRDGYNRLTGQQVLRECYGAPTAVAVNDANATIPGAATSGTPSGITIASSTQSNRTVGLFNYTLPSATTQALGVASTPVVTSSTTTPTILITPLNNNVATNPNTNYNYQFDGAQPVKFVTNGPQTPKLVQPPLELWHKLKFWFCDDVRLAVPSVSIPFGQRFITVTLAPQSQLAYEFPNLYTTGTSQLGAYDVPAATGGISLLTGAANTAYITNAVNKYNQPRQIVGFGGTTPIIVEQIELYINNIFVNPEIHDIYIKRIGFSLIRVYREQQSRQNQSTSGSELMSQLKWPVEYMYVGLRPAWNIADPVPAVGPNSGTQLPQTATSVNYNSWRDWHRMTRQVDAQFTGSIGGLSSMAASGGGNGGTAGTNSINSVNTPITAMTPDFYWLPVSTADSLSLQAHGITIFDSFQDIFYSEYMPYHYGGAALNTPNDHGAFFVNMALFPRSYQPSGHLNISRARETYLNWSTSYITSNSTADLIVVAVAINFLLISDGSAVLRYST